MTNSYSLEYTRNTGRGKEIQNHPLGGLVALILATARNGSTAETLAPRTRSTENRISKYLQALEKAGFITVIRDSTDTAYRTTPEGMKFLHAFESFEQLAASRRSRYISKECDYATCNNCEPHPMFPKVHPLTLHENGVCLVCQKKS